MRFLKRIRRRLFISIAAILVFVAVAALISTQTHMALRKEAQQILDAELTSIGRSLIGAFDRKAAEVIGRISQARLAEAEGCSAQFQNVSRYLVGSLEHIQDIGFVASDGTLACSVLRPAQPIEGFLKPWSLDTPTYTLAVLEDAQLERRPLVLVINNGLNQRYVIRLAPSVLPEDIGSTLIRPYLSYDALLTTGDRWVHVDNQTMNRHDLGPIASRAIDPRSLPERFSRTMTSKSFPLVVTVAAESEVLPVIYDGLDNGAVQVGILAGIVILFLLLLIGWRSGRPEFEYSAVFDEGEFLAYYQPVVDMGNGSILGCEVLLRFKTREGKLVQPAAFIAYAETTGVIMDVTHDLMTRVAEELDELSKEFGHLKIGINLTGKHFEDMAVVDDIRSIFGKTNISFQQLVFELTERHPVQDFQVARMAISGMQELGASVALDDAGTGHGGFSYLQKLGLDVIKIDKMFVDSFSNDVTTMTIIDIIVELAKSLDMGIIAEGVENQDQVNSLRKLGISAAQGYFFSPPLPPEQYIDLVKRSEAAENKFAVFEATRISPLHGFRPTDILYETEAEVALPVARAS